MNAGTLPPYFTENYAMEKSALILGGTYGLGLSLAKTASILGITPIICGRSVNDPQRNERFPTGATLLAFDAEQPEKFVGSLPTTALEADYVIYNCGTFMRERFADCSPRKMRRLITINLTTAIEITQEYHARRIERSAKPYQLILIASSSSFKVRAHEAAYCASKAGLAHFGRNIAMDLAADLPGTKVLIVNPGGIKTELFKETDQNTSSFMEPDDVAHVIWIKARLQETTPDEINILRSPGTGDYEISNGPKTPESHPVAVR